MPRRLRIEFEGTIDDVMARGNARQGIDSDHASRDRCRNCGDDGQRIQEERITTVAGPEPPQFVRRADFSVEAEK
jgi:hypothetical protein